MIYLDYAATTPLDPIVVDAMTTLLQGARSFGNPSSGHYYGVTARQSVEQARAKVARLIGANTTEVIFTSGATESINTAIKGIAQRQQHKGKHIITSQIEHSAALETCKYLGKQGFSVTYLKPDTEGIIHPQTLKAAIHDDTILVSMMNVNNETGVIQDITEMGRICRTCQIPFHVDAVQAIGKLPVDVKQQNIDLLSLSAHKCYGPKGVGALYIKDASYIKLTPLLHGGGQENGLRSGTLATHQIVGLGKAAELASQNIDKVGQKLKKLRDQLWHGIKNINGITLNGNLANMAPHIINISVDQSLIDVVKWQSHIAFSSRSACHTGDTTSHVLTAMGIPVAQAQSSIRLSIGRFTTEEDIKTVVDIIHANCQATQCL